MHPEQFPEYLRKKKPFKAWIKEIRFKKYFEAFQDKLPGPYYETEKTNLFYWIDQSRKMGFENFKIITAKDDILNSPEDWAVYDPDFIERQVLMLPWGGHAGFKSTQWFQLLLDLNFGPRLIQTNEKQADSISNEETAIEQFQKEMSEK